MKDVGWGEILIAIFLAPVLVFPVVLVVYVILFIIMDVSVGAVSDWYSVTIAVTCVIEGLILAAMYKGEDDAIEHGWAWLLVAGIIAAAALIPFAAGVISQDLALFIMEFLVGIAWIFLTVMLAVFLNDRWKDGRKRSASPESSKLDVERDMMTMTLKR